MLHVKKTALKTAKRDAREEVARLSDLMSSRFGAKMRNFRGKRTAAWTGFFYVVNIFHRDVSHAAEKAPVFRRRTSGTALRFNRFTQV